MKKNKILLSDLETSFNDDKAILINDENSVGVEDLIIIKRDGREEKYDVNKMRKVCMWASNDREIYANSLLSSTRIKLYNKIKIEDVYDELIKTASNKINRIGAEYEKIAARLLLLKLYKDSWNIKKSNYPDYSSVVEKALKFNKYNYDLFNDFTEEEIKELGEYINPEYDFLFTYKSLYIFHEKYCLEQKKNKKIELPQHVYMRVAISLFKSEKKSKRIELIKNFYDTLAQHMFTLATPIMLNAGTKNQQLSSCVLIKVGDDTNSIMDCAKSGAIYSKNKGGLAIDVSSIRCSSSTISGNGGISSGPVPFIKIFESTIKAFNQGSQRPGACCIYFQWWNYNFKELVVLKNNTGTEENRARQLKYSIKINDLLIQRVLNNESVTLFDPKDTPELLNTFGKEFEEKYIYYENKAGIKKSVIEASELIALLFKERSETGNIYLFHEENINNATLLNRYINSSNLCCEIALPSRETKLIEEVNYEKDGDTIIQKKYQSGEISLCNLASINIYSYEKSSNAMKLKIVKSVVRGLDNSIDEAKYPVIEGKITNEKYRYLGIGILNLANYLADKKIIIDSEESLEEQHRIMDELSFNIITASNELAKEKGSFLKFNETQWADGVLPIHKANKKALSLTKYQPDLDKWNKLANEIKNFGLRNAQLMAIAPTATSGKAINATEGVEPISDIFYKEDGKINLPTLVPNIKNWQYYKIAIDCDQYMLLKAAAIRQCYIDQSQSTNVYFKKITSLLDFSLFHFLGFELGIKTFYYCKTLKEVIEHICESCT